MLSSTQCTSLVCVFVHVSEYKIYFGCKFAGLHVCQKTRTKVSAADPGILWMEWNVSHLSDEACWSANVFDLLSRKICRAVFSWRIPVLLSQFESAHWLGGLAGMDRYRYFIFKQKSMVVLGLFQITCATICIISGLIDVTFRKESALSKSKIPIWAGVVSSIPPPFAFVR